MTNDTIIRLAQEAGLPTTIGWLDSIMRFAAAVAGVEREACAIAVEDASKAYWAYQAAKIVRARGQA